MTWPPGASRNSGRYSPKSARQPDEAARQTKLLESCKRASALRERAGLPELLPIWQLVSCAGGTAEAALEQAGQRQPFRAADHCGRTGLAGGPVPPARRGPTLATEPPVRLLAVDDDPISRRAMSLALAKAFKAPDLAPDGQAALDLAGRQTYDVIFLDVEMPGMDGYELCTRIHETELNRTTPVVFVTLHSDFDSRAKSTALGAGGHLQTVPCVRDHRQGPDAGDKIATQAGDSRATLSSPQHSTHTAGAQDAAGVPAANAVAPLFLPDGWQSAPPRAQASPSPTHSIRRPKGSPTPANGLQSRVRRPRPLAPHRGAKPRRSQRPVLASAL